MRAEIIRFPLTGAAPELVKEQLRKIVGETDVTEIMAMEQQLMAEGMPVEESIRHGVHSEAMLMERSDRDGGHGPGQNVFLVRTANCDSPIQ